MSGHSKWANIKRKKGVNDAKKGQIFSKMSRLITNAAKQGGGATATNPVLRLAVERAKQARMPKENIERAIQNGIGADAASENYEDVVYEGYGPFGVAFLVKGITDNKNRTTSEIRNIFAKCGGGLGSVGSTIFIFSPDPQSPNYVIDIGDKDGAGKVLALAEALEDHDDVHEVFANFSIRNDLTAEEA